jgi:hypothetical protein
LATSIALEASPVARCTYCDIVEDGRPRARVVHSDAPAKGLRAIGLTEARRSRKRRKSSREIRASRTVNRRSIYPHNKKRRWEPESAGDSGACHA